MSNQTIVVPAAVWVGSLLFWSDGFESGDGLAWTGISGAGWDIQSDGEAYEGVYHNRATITNGEVNVYGGYLNYGTPGNLSTQIRNFYAQIRTSMNTFTGAWPTDTLKIFIYQFYDSTWNGGVFSNSNRKYQVILTVAGSGAGAREGEYAIELIEWNNEDVGQFVKSAYVFQNSTSHSPSDSFGSWDTLRVRVDLDTNGTGALGSGQGDGVLQVWLNSALILDYSDVNFVDGNTDVGIGRLLLAYNATDNWVGTTTFQYSDEIQIADGPSALSFMPSSAQPRAAGNRVIEVPVAVASITGYSGNVVSSSPTISIPLGGIATTGYGPTIGGAGDNPDSYATATSTYISRDYNTEDDDDTWTGNLGETGDPGRAVTDQAYSSSAGYSSSGVWTITPTPDTLPHEDNAGYFNGSGSEIAADATDILTISYLLYISQGLADDIAAGTGGFWSHGNKTIDVFMWDSGATQGDETTRQVIKFRTDSGAPKFSHIRGGAGAEFYDDGVNINPDWTTIADEYVWVMHVFDATNNYTRTYYKRQGDTSVTKALERGSGDGDGDYTYGTRGWTLNGPAGGPARPVWGYWDDIGGISYNANNFIRIDRLRTANGWIDPPF